MVEDSGEAITGEVITNLEALIAAARRCADQIEVALLAYQDVLERLQEGTSVPAVLAAVNVAETRRDLTEALEELQSNASALPGSR